MFASAQIHAISIREETMNALRKLSAAILLGSLSLFALGALAAPAHAAQPFNDIYCRDHVVYGNTLQYYPTTSLYRSYYRTAHSLRTYSFFPQPVCYPVTLYDAFGRPYVVYPTSYSAFDR
jgi:hypothetical protein